MKGNNMYLAVAALSAACMLLPGCANKSAAAGTGAKAEKTSYVFSAVNRGTIEKTVSASGTIEPVSTVSVIPQMSGIVEKVFADYNQRVKKGQTLVELNTETLGFQREEQKAAVDKARATYELQLVAYGNQQKLAEKGLVSDYDLKSTKTTLDVDAAELASAESALKLIETEINQYAIIKAPITGIVLNRNVDVGGSVSGNTNSNATTLYTLAEDLAHMQIVATVDEMDIASIHQSQAVKFTVEALPGKTFSGKVQMVRMVPSTSDNVVSYSVVVAIDNAEGSLLPGMTAEAQFVVKSDENALLVPNSALRYQPTSLSQTQIADAVFQASLAGLTDEQKTAAMAAHDAAAKKAAAGAGSGTGSQTGLSSLVMGGGGPGGPGGYHGAPGGTSGSNSQSKTAGTWSGAKSAAAATKNVWYLDGNGKPAVLSLRIGISDGTNTEVFSDTDLEGKKIIVKEQVM